MRRSRAPVASLIREFLQNLKRRNGDRCVQEKRRVQHLQSFLGIRKRGSSRTRNWIKRARLSPQRRVTSKPSSTRRGGKKRASSILGGPKVPSMRIYFLPSSQSICAGAEPTQTHASGQDGGRNPVPAFAIVYRCSNEFRKDRFPGWVGRDLLSRSCATPEGGNSQRLLLSFFFSSQTVDEARSGATSETRWRPTRERALEARSVLLSRHQSSGSRSTRAAIRTVRGQ